AQQAATVQALAGGRLTLGVGVSHRPVIENMFGLGYSKPAAHMREYLQVLVPMLAEGKVSHHGEFFDVEAEITVPGTTPVPVVVGALSPGMLRVAGELADGAVTWLVGPRALETHVVPAVSDASRQAGRSNPRVVAALPVSVCDDRDEGRERANEIFARYAGLVNYQRTFERQGASSPADLAVIGNEDQVTKQVRAVADTGVTELWPVVFAVGDNQARTRSILASLAQEID
ncbi:MAG: TIGR03564 family F420-dependent LLM class oxidoreductase, partial [Actinomycetota bacterium]|nr:TIGR03564 family F420-dependent LLM class oxidoreductase [Actinomycetota bacterium]